MKIYNYQDVVLYDTINYLIAVDQDIKIGKHSKVGFRTYRTKKGRKAIRIFKGGNFFLSIDIFTQPEKNQFLIGSNGIDIRVKGMIPLNIKVS